MANEIRKVRVNGTLYPLDYNSLANRPFGVLTETMVWEETDLAFSAGGGTCYSEEKQPAAPIIDGGTYIVTWDGVNYECVAFSQPGVVFLGNPVLVNAEIEGGDADAPFVIGYFNNAISAATADEGTHSVKVMCRDVSRINSEYLPDALQFGMTVRAAYLEERMDEVFSEITVGSDKQGLPVAMSGEISVQGGLIPGDTYIVTWDGTEYACVAYSPADGVAILGSESIFSNGVYPAGAEPFVIEVADSVLVAATGSDGVGDHTFRIDHMAVTTIDEKYLPAYLRTGGETTETVLPEQTDVAFSEYQTTQQEI